MKPEDAQYQYYTQTARSYDSMHVNEGDEHFIALGHVWSLSRLLNISSFLDVGSGTGRAVKYFMEKGATVKGIEPVSAMIEQAVLKNGIPKDLIIRGRGEALPFDDSSFDAVCEFGSLHHMRKPNSVVTEMMRVAKKAVFLSDSNRFGQGSMASRLIKLLLYKLNLWDAANFVKTRGKGFIFSEGDGISYSYSVFDSYDLLSAWADKIILIPTGGEKAVSWHHPLLTSGNVLLCAIKEK